MRIFRILWHRIRPIVNEADDPLKKTTFFGALFGKYLLATNIISSGVLMSIGDLMSQEIEQRSAKSTSTQQFDWTRNAKMFVVGAAQGPLHHYFYGWLDRAYIGSTVKITTIKILYDQLIMSPACIAAFFYTAGWMDGKGNSQCTEEFQSKFIRVYITDWLIWPATQFLNFYYLPPKYRVIYVNFVTMLYNIFLSHIKHEDAHHAAIAPSAEANLDKHEDEITAAITPSVLRLKELSERFIHDSQPAEKKE